MQPAPIQQFTLGGPLRLSAYGVAQFRGSNYGLVAGGYRHRLGSFPTLIGGRIYGSVWYEGGSTFFRRSDLKYRDDVAGAVVLDTLLGTGTIGGAWGKGGTGEYFLLARPVFLGPARCGIPAGSELSVAYAVFQWRSLFCNQIVVDKTALTGSYDFTLDWAPEETQDSSAPSLVTAIQEQLGLRLESQKAPVDVLLVDALGQAF